MKMTDLPNMGRRLLMLAVCGSALIGGVALAQDTSAASMQPPAPATSPAQQGHGGERMLERMTKKLNLSPDQVTQIRAIDVDTVNKVQAVRGDSSLAGKDRQTKAMAIRQASQMKIRAVLTDEQRPRYDEMLGRMQARAGSRGGGQAGSGAPPML